MKGQPSSPIPRLILPLYVPTFLMSVGSGVLIPTLPLYAHSFGVSFTLVTLAISMLGIGTLVANVPSGILLARTGGRPTMLGGTAIVALSSVALPFSGLFPLVLVFRLVAGVGTSLWSVSRFAFIAETVPVMHRGRTVALFGGVSRAGTLVGPIIGGLLADRIGVEAALFSSGLFSALAFGVCVPFIKESHLKPAYAGSGSIIQGIRRAATTRPRQFASASAAQMFAQLIRGGRTAVVPLVGSFAIGLDVDTVGFIVGASAFIDMALFYPPGFVMDRWGRKFASVPSFLILAAGMGMVALASDTATLFAAAAVMGLGSGLSSGTMMTLGADLAPNQARAPFLGYWRLVGDAGTTGGPLVVGGIADLWGLAVSAAVVAGFGLLAGLTLAFFVPETLREHGPSVGRPAP